MRYWTEAAIKEELDGWFFAVHFHSGAIKRVQVSNSHIPTHEPITFFDFDERAARARRWTKDEDDLIVRLRRRGLSYTFIAHELDCSPEAVGKRFRAICRERGWRVRDVIDGRPRVHPDELVMKIRADIDAGLTTAQVGQKYGMSRQSVYDIYRRGQGAKTPRRYVA